MRYSEATVELTEDSRHMRSLMHEIANSLHLLGLQTELARSHMSVGDREAANAAMEAVLRERDNCSKLTRELHERLRDSG